MCCHRCWNREGMTVFLCITKWIIFCYMSYFIFWSSCLYNTCIWSQLLQLFKVQKSNQGLKDGGCCLLKKTTELLRDILGFFLNENSSLHQPNALLHQIILSCKPLGVHHTMETHILHVFVCLHADLCSPAHSLYAVKHNTSPKSADERRVTECWKKIFAPGEAAACASLNQISLMHTDPHVAGPSKLPINWAALLILLLNLQVSQTPLRLSVHVVGCLPLSISQHDAWKHRHPVAGCFRHLLHGSPRLSDRRRLCEVMSRQQSKHYTNAPSPHY